MDKDYIHIINCIDKSEEIYYSILNNITFNKVKYIKYNKDMSTPRYTQFYGGHNKSCEYYKEIPDIIKNIVNDVCKKININNDDYNSIIVNLYDDDSSISFHSDDESFTKEDHSIISMNFGHCAYFRIRNKMRKKGDKAEKILLQNGDVFIMKPGFQNKYEHAVNKRTKKEKNINKYFKYRINITLRQLSNIQGTKNYLKYNCGYGLPKTINNIMFN
jgi:alkylated DNA repair dioxygenase AlkB